MTVEAFRHKSKDIHISKDISVITTIFDSNVNKVEMHFIDSKSSFFTVTVQDGSGEASVRFNTREEFKKFVDEVNWVFEQIKNQD